MTSIRAFTKRLFGRTSFITVVSGLPRSGTSMMMSALQAGGLPLLVDHFRGADANNPKGYYEFERAKKLPKGDIAWLWSAQGKAVKIISALLEFLPQKFEYKVIFMERDLDEILASQSRMLERNGKQDDHPITQAEIRQSYQEHLNKIKNYLSVRDWFQPLYVSYNNILQQPEDEFRKIADFLDIGLDPEKMVQKVDPNLYRQKN
jgi:hypothetical protein